MRCKLCSYTSLSWWIWNGEFTFKAITKNESWFKVSNSSFIWNGGSFSTGRHNKNCLNFTSHFNSGLKSQKEKKFRPCSSVQPLSMIIIAIILDLITFVYIIPPFELNHLESFSHYFDQIDGSCDEEKKKTYLGSKTIRQSSKVSFFLSLGWKKTKALPMNTNNPFMRKLLFNCYLILSWSTPVQPPPVVAVCNNHWLNGSARWVVLHWLYIESRDCGLLFLFPLLRLFSFSPRLLQLWRSSSMKKGKSSSDFNGKRLSRLSRALWWVILKWIERGSYWTVSTQYMCLSMRMAFNSVLVRWDTVKATLGLSRV